MWIGVDGRLFKQVDGRWVEQEAATSRVVRYVSPKVDVDDSAPFPPAHTTVLRDINFWWR